MPLPRKATHYSNDLISKTVIRKLRQSVIDTSSNIRNDINHKRPIKKVTRAVKIAIKSDKAAHESYQR